MSFLCLLLARGKCRFGLLLNQLLLELYQMLAEPCRCTFLCLSIVSLDPILKPSGGFTLVGKAGVRGRELLKPVKNMAIM